MVGPRLVYTDNMAKAHVLSNQSSEFLKTCMIYCTLRTRIQNTEGIFRTQGPWNGIFLTS